MMAALGRQGRGREGAAGVRSSLVSAPDLIDPAALRPRCAPPPLVFARRAQTRLTRALVDKAGRAVATTG